MAPEIHPNVLGEFEARKKAQKREKQSQNGSLVQYPLIGHEMNFLTIYKVKGAILW